MSIQRTSPVETHRSAIVDYTVTSLSVAVNECLPSAAISGLVSLALDLDPRIGVIYGAIVPILERVLKRLGIEAFGVKFEKPVLFTSIVAAVILNPAMLLAVGMVSFFGKNILCAALNATGGSLVSNFALGSQMPVEIFFGLEAIRQVGLYATGGFFKA